MEALVAEGRRPLSIEVVAYENDHCILPELAQTMARCEIVCGNEGIAFHGEIRNEDFVSAAITPRSFCNGPYFREFRLALLKMMSLRRIHVFESRKKAFGDQEAGNPLVGITHTMEFFEEYYGKRYAPNTRETVRRQTVHQFMQAALIVPNPDKPSRPTNSPKAVYQIEPSALQLLRGYGKRGWKKRLQEYLLTVGSLNKLYARERDMERIPVTLENGQALRLSPGGHNALVKKIIDEFCILT